MKTVLMAIAGVLLLASAAPAQSGRLTRKDVENYTYQANCHRPWSNFDRWLLYERSSRPPRNEEERKYAKWRRELVLELRGRSTPPEVAADLADVYDMIGEPRLAAETRLRLVRTVSSRPRSSKRRREVTKVLNRALINAGMLNNPRLTERLLREGQRVFPDSRWIEDPHAIVDYFSERELSRVTTPLPQVMQWWESMVTLGGWFARGKEAIHAVGMLGKPAPELVVERMVGASSKPVLAELRGKVVLLERRHYFNAGTLDPEDVDHMRKLVRAHESDLQVIGVRSFQGSFTNREMGIDPDYGNPRKLTADEELDFWREMHGHYGLPWPYVFEGSTKGSKNYERYPGATYVLIDRAGLVRYMHWSPGGIHRIIKAAEKLLAEVPGSPH